MTILLAMLSYLLFLYLPQILKVFIMQKVKSENE